MRGFALRMTLAMCLIVPIAAYAQQGPLPIDEDPLVRMPGTQHGQAQIEGPANCVTCHGSTADSPGQGFDWRGSMMGQSARDFLFWPAFAVAGQDSIWATGRPVAMDLCERCHFPEGWLEGRSDPPNASVMQGSDFDGVHCDFCHTMSDPFFADAHANLREPADAVNYWDETNASTTPSEDAREATFQADAEKSLDFGLFDGSAFFGQDLRPVEPGYTENGAGQFFMTGGTAKRGPFADANPLNHEAEYSRYTKSKFFCGTCHDVSNPVLANLEHIDARPGDGTRLPSETQAAHSYFHVERTFSEFMLSDYGLDGGAPGVGPFAPDQFGTSLPNNHIARCQDCHMNDFSGRGAAVGNILLRPDESIEHPLSGQPSHAFAGGNLFVSWVLASTVEGAPNYDATNAELLRQGPEMLTLDLDAGLGVHAEALLAGVRNTEGVLRAAASIEDLEYDNATGLLGFRVQNNTGHKLISGYPEGRRMFLNVRVFEGGALVYEVNPYDAAVGTLRGLPENLAPDGPPLGANEAYADALVYEANMSSSLTGETKTFHFALATNRHKDNRIPPKGFRIAEAPERLSQPVWEGEERLDFFTAAEYAGGYDEVSLEVPAGADRIEVNLYYQTTSREYIAFLRDEINGTGATLPVPEAYVMQTDPFFAQLRAWGDTVWALWEHNKDVPGAAPFLMTQGVYEGEVEEPPTGPGPGCAPGIGLPNSAIADFVLLAALLTALAFATRLFRQMWLTCPTGATETVDRS
jgi:hypothetical protein